MTAKQPFMRFQRQGRGRGFSDPAQRIGERPGLFADSAPTAAAMCAKQRRPAKVRRPSRARPAARTSNRSSSTKSENRPAAGRGQAVREQPHRYCQGCRRGRQAQRAKARGQRQQREACAEAARPAGRRRDLGLVRSAAGRRRRSANLPYVAHPQFKRTAGEDILKSPWPWTALAGLIFVVLLFSARALIPWPQTTSGDHRPDRRTSEPARGGRCRRRCPPPISPAKPADAVPMPAIVDSAVLNKLIADAKVIAVTLRTNIPDKPSALNQIVSEQLQDTFRQLDVTGRPANPSSPNRMDLTLIMARSGNLINVELSAELTCTTPYGKSVTAWKVETTSCLLSRCAAVGRRYRLHENGS